MKWQLETSGVSWEGMIVVESISERRIRERRERVSNWVYEGGMNVMEMIVSIQKCDDKMQTVRKWEAQNSKNKNTSVE